MKQQRAAYAKQVVKRTPDTVELKTDEQVASAKLDAILIRRNKPGAIADVIANSTFYYVNWYYPEGRTEWPQHNNLRHVNKMYPYAEGGKLLVDEPRHEYEFQNCEMKRAVLKKLGYRYLIVKPGMTVEEAVAGMEIA